MRINNIPNLTSNIPATNKKERQGTINSYKNLDINLNSDPKSFLGISILQTPAWKKLKPKAFSTVTKENYNPGVKHGAPIQYKYIVKSEEGTGQTFRTELKPKTLEVENSKKTGVDLMNLAYPNGTIGLATKLNDVISTSGMWQCAAVSFVNKKENTQVLVHFCPTIHKDDNENLIKYIMENISKDGLEINIAPGCFSDTDNTISFLVDTIKKYDKNAKIEFCNFPKEHDRVILEKGKLKCIKDELFKTTECNPIDRIFYASMKR